MDNLTSVYKYAILYIMKQVNIRLSDYDKKEFNRAVKKAEKMLGINSLTCLIKYLIQRFLGDK